MEKCFAEAFGKRKWEGKLSETTTLRDLEGGGNAWLYGLLAWAVPGAGHLAQGRWRSGLLLGGAVWVMFLTGLAFGGHLYSLFHSTTGLLSHVFGLFDLGMGLVYVFCQAAGVGVDEQAARATSEYGNVFLMVSGLLNYLLALDAYDIRAGRKH